MTGRLPAGFPVPSRMAALRGGWGALRRVWLGVRRRRGGRRAGAVCECEQGECASGGRLPGQLPSRLPVS
ncbi:hypothetical protein Srufu_040910 [Streptomyces libani subsp. rufus]|nr:hypothetical protein Srufu_040910 [Streptomyces libani subsp. rufus]